MTERIRKNNPTTRTVKVLAVLRGFCNVLDDIGFVAAPTARSERRIQRQGGRELEHDLTIATNKLGSPYQTMTMMKFVLVSTFFLLGLNVAQAQIGPDDL